MALERSAAAAGLTALEQACHGLPLAPLATLLKHCGIEDLEAWTAEAPRLMALVQDLPGEGAVHWGLWLPLFSRVRQLLRRGERLVLGVNGPIGCGKSTLMAALSRLAAAESLPVAVASIDDAYLGWADRQRVLAGNPFGVWRGPPGSHDVALLLDRLNRWQAGEELVLPRFDKRLRQGQGDRSGAWRGAPQLLVLEGWLLGCRALPPERLPFGSPASLPGLEWREQELAWLPIWNQRLLPYHDLWNRLEALWVLRPTSWEWPRRWRIQAEARQRRQVQASGEGRGPSRSAQALNAADLSALVRACLLSLPPALYQDPLVLGPEDPAEAAAEAVVVLDGRRRCRWSGLVNGSSPQFGDQASASLSSSATG